MLYIVLFAILGKFKKLKIATLNIYPFLILGSRMKFSISFFNLIKIKNTYHIDGVNVEDISIIIGLKEKIESVVGIICLFITFIFLVIGLFYKNILFIMFFCIACLKFIIEENGKTTMPLMKEEKMLYYELVFSKYAGKELYEYHLNYLVKNINKYIQEPEKLNDIILILFAFFNNRKNLDLKMLEVLDRSVIRLIRNFNNDLAISCRDILFDYVDNRICLDINVYERGYITDFLNYFISFDWDVNLPSLYMERRKELIGYMEGKIKNLYFRKGYEIYLVDQENI